MIAEARCYFAAIVRCQLPRIYGHQKALAGIARATLIGQQFKIPILRLDEDQPHLAAAFRAGHPLSKIHPEAVVAQVAPELLAKQHLDIRLVVDNTRTRKLMNLLRLCRGLLCAEE